MKSYNQRVNKITQEFILFAGFAAMEERFRALNNNNRSDDDVDNISYGFATSGLAVCGSRLLYAMADLGYVAYKDCANYFYQSNHQAALQLDPFVQLKKNLQEAGDRHQLNVDRIKELEKKLEEGNEELERQENTLTIRIAELEKEITTLKTTLNTQSSLNINLTK